MTSARIEEVNALDLNVTQRAWPFAKAEAKRIADHWQERIAAKPRLFNGRVLMLGRHAIERGHEGNLFRGEYFETDFAAFLAWRDFNYPDPDVANAFAMAALIGADGGYLVGEMAPHTANAGKVYFAAGTPDPEDIFAGKVDLTASALRELGEETGVQPHEVAFGTSWTLVYAPPRIAFLKIMRLAEPAETAKARIEAFLAKDAEAELCAIHVVRRPRDVDRQRTPAFLASFFDFAFAQRSVG
ncbi:MAG: NUDIX hydrolase [Bradyrhizobium sp.]|nr:MAG: NUDIX hydrolase [Bradyrhizobium sp.]